MKQDKATQGIKIEGGVPIPLARNGKGHAAALRRLRVGDSFTVKGNRVVQSSIIVAAKRLGVKITTRKLEDAIRVWRVA